MDSVFLVFSWNDLISIHRTREGADKRLAEEEKGANMYSAYAIVEKQLED